MEDAISTNLHPVIMHLENDIRLLCVNFSSVFNTITPMKRTRELETYEKYLTSSLADSGPPLQGSNKKHPDWKTSQTGVVGALPRPGRLSCRWLELPRISLVPLYQASVILVK